MDETAPPFAAFSLRHAMPLSPNSKRERKRWQQSCILSMRPHLSEPGSAYAASGPGSPLLKFLLEHRLQPTPSPLCGLASWPLLGACSMFPRE